MGGRGRLIVIMGSKSDLEFARRIRGFLESEGFTVKCEYDVASAHRTPDVLLEKLKKYESSGGNLVYITVAGLSDALSGVVAGYTKHPVIACPPDLDRYGWIKAFSSAMTPKGVAVLLATNPENAALAAVEILALSDNSLYTEVENYKRRRRESTIRAAEEVKGLEGRNK